MKKLGRNWKKNLSNKMRMEWEGTFLKTFFLKNWDRIYESK